MANRWVPRDLERSKARRRAWREVNRERSREHWRKWKRANPEKVKASVLKREYGLSLEEYDRLLLKQGGVCAICGSDKPGSKYKNFSVDHDHETKEVRGLLCGSCNRGLGLFKDSVAVLTKAAKYLSSFR